MELTPDLRLVAARARDRAKTYRCPVDPGTIAGDGTHGQVKRVEVVAFEPVLDQTVLYLRIERSNPVRHVTVLVQPTGFAWQGTRGTVTFRIHPSGRGAWEFEPAVAPSQVIVSAR